MVKRRPLDTDESYLKNRVSDLAFKAKQQVAMHQVGNPSEEELHPRLVKALAHLQAPFAECRDELLRLKLDARTIEDFVWLNVTLAKYKK